MQKHNLQKKQKKQRIFPGSKLSTKTLSKKEQNARMDHNIKPRHNNKRFSIHFKTLQNKRKNNNCPINNINKNKKRPKSISYLETKHKKNEILQNNLQLKNPHREIYVIPHN